MRGEQPAPACRLPPDRPPDLGPGALAARHPGEKGGDVRLGDLMALRWHRDLSAMGASVAESRALGVLACVGA